MSTLHDVTQTQPFVLSGDGAFLRVKNDRERSFRDHYEKFIEQHPASTELQESSGDLLIHGMHTTKRTISGHQPGLYLYVRPGGTRGYDESLDALIEGLAGELEEFEFFVLWHNNKARELSNLGGKFNSQHHKIADCDYHRFFHGKLENKPLVLLRYFVESGLWAKRSYDDSVADHNDGCLYAEEFPDAIQILQKALAIKPDDSEAIAAMNWYENHIAQDRG